MENVKREEKGTITISLTFLSDRDNPAHVGELVFGKEGA